MNDVPQSANVESLAEATVATNPEPAINAAATLALDALSVKRSHNAIIDTLSFTTHKKCIRICGSNGSGKTTLLLAIAGLFPVAAGTIRLLSLDTTAARRIRCGVVSSALSVPAYLSVDQALGLFKSDKSKSPLDFEEQLLRGIPLHTPYGGLSEGQKRKVEIVCALRKERGILLMDEPFNALDQGAVELLQIFLAQYPGLLIYVDHRENAIRGDEARIVL